MNSKKVYFGMLGLTALSIILLVGCVFGGNKLLTKKSKELISLRLESRVLDEQQLSLTKAKKDIERYSELYNVSKAIVPQDKDQAKTVRELVAIAGQSGIPISGVSFPASSLGKKVTKTATSSDSSSSSTASSATATTPPLSQLTEVKGITGVYQMQVSLQADKKTPITYAAFIGFLQRLENNRRTAQVSNISINPNKDNLNELTFNLGINVFVKP